MQLFLCNRALSSAKVVGEKKDLRHCKAAIKWRSVPEVPSKLNERVRDLLKDDSPNVLYSDFEHLCQDLQKRTRKNGDIFVDKEKKNQFITPPLLDSADKFIEPFGYTPNRTKAYVGFRMTSSFAILRRLLRDCAENRPSFRPTSVLDFGAGPATGMWAVEDVWPGAARNFLNVEPSESMIEAGDFLMEGGPFDDRRVEWCSTLTDPAIKSRRFSLVIGANVLGELPSDRARAAALQLMWRHVDPEEGTLLLVEPGTKWGFRAISTVRDVLVDRRNDEVSINAPCTHHMRCPLLEKEKNPRGIWCRFPQRAPYPPIVSSTQRLKGAKAFPPTSNFTYLLASASGEKRKHEERIDGMIPGCDRIMSDPLLRNKHVIMDVCSAHGELERRTHSKGKLKPFPGAYRAARKSQSGGLWLPVDENADEAGA
eukprot:g5357.t1